MKKIARILVILVLVFCLVGLLGCANSKVTYQDPATGEEKEIKIEKTSNDQEVTDSIYAIALSSTPIKSSKKLTYSISFNARLKVKASDGTLEDFEAQGKLTTSSDFDYNEDFTTYYEFLKDAKASAKLELKGRVPSADGKLESFSTSTVEIFLEDCVLYAKIDLDNKLVNFIERQDSKTANYIKLLNGKTIKYDLNEVIPNHKLSDEEKDQIISTMNESGDKSVRDILENSNVPLKELRAQIEDFVKDSGLVISNVSGGDVTYSVDLSNELGKNTQSKILLDVTIDVSEVALVSAKLSADLKEIDATGTANIELSVSYKAKVSTISNDDKTSAVDVATLIGGTTDTDKTIRKLDNAGYTCEWTANSEVGKDGEIGTLVAIKGKSFGSFIDSLGDGLTAVLYDSSSNAEKAYNDSKNDEDKTNLQLIGNWVVWGSEEAIKAFK